MAADDTVVRNNDELEQHFGEKKDTPTEQSEKFSSADTLNISADTLNIGETNRDNKADTLGNLYSTEEKDIPFEGSETPGVKNEEASKKYAERLEKAKNRMNSDNKDAPNKGEVNRNNKDSTFGKLYSEDSIKDSNADSGLNLKADTDFSKLVFEVTFASLEYAITPAAFDKKVNDFKERTAHLRKHDPEYYDAIIKDFNLLSEAIKKKLERIKLHNERLNTMFETLRVTTPPLNVTQPEPIEIGFEVVITPKTLLKTVLVGAAALGVYYLGKRRR